VIRVVIVNDQPTLRRGLRMLLAAEPDMEVVGEAANDRMAVTACEALGPDVALIDVEMANLGGLAVAEALRSACPRTRVVVLSLYDDPDTRARVERAGAAGFVRKHSPAEMVAALREAAR
jgi:DNA-binding NarL/FixJ family response regulator